jgi:hypothetical protein
VPRTRRAHVALALAALVPALVASVSLPAYAARTGHQRTLQKDDNIFKERWCADGAAAPCVESATRNGVPFTSADPQVEIQSDGRFHIEGVLDSSMYNLLPLGGTQLNPDDSYSILIDLGTMPPDTTQNIAGDAVAERILDGDGTYHLRFTGKPVLRTLGCESEGFPPPCPDVATSQEVQFRVDVHDEIYWQKYDGMDWSQNVNLVNGIFLHDPGGRQPKYLSSDMWNSRFQVDGKTPAEGFVRFRLPYPLLVSDFDVPDPASLGASSMVGLVNGKPADFELTQDPAGGGVYIEISGVTFAGGSGKKLLSRALAKPKAHQAQLRIERGDISPTRVKLKSASRSGGKAVLRFKAARSRGAFVTRYQARCTAKDSLRTVTGKAKQTRLSVAGLVAGKSYSCQVRAGSKEGYGAWSKARKL